ncbi:MAG: hypothetical protein IPM51_16955 [Sphingobacteriaceae bacterium]|nr:hypothetical protein [Sphingobacteriaceae bacterium]
MKVQLGIFGIRSEKIFSSCILFFLLSFNVLHSQTYFSTDSFYLFKKYESNNGLFGFQPAYPDSTVFDEHEFFPRNYLGNVGLSSPNYHQAFQTDHLGFRLIPSFLSSHKFNVRDVSYYRSKGPYASVNGIAGSKQLQILKLIFTHTYKEKINLTVQFNRYNSKGFYANQQSYTNNFYISSNSISKKGRAGYYFYFLNNINRFQENGGIIGDTLNEATIIEPKELLGVKLQSATRTNKENSAMINPWFKLNRTPDSLNKLNSYLQLKSIYSWDSYLFKDDNLINSNYYFLFYHDTLKTYDSTSLKQFKNEISYTLRKGGGGSGISIGCRNEINQLWQKNDSLFQNNSVFADILFIQKKSKDSLSKNHSSLTNRNNLQYIFQGPNQGNYLIENNTNLKLKNETKTEFYLNASVESRNPDHFFNTWVSNHFVWLNNGFNPLQVSQIEIGTRLFSKIKLSVFGKNTSNYIYMDELAYPHQYSGNLQQLGVKTQALFIVKKHLGLYLEHIYQMSNNSAILSFPEHSGKARLFYAGNLFKNHLQLNTGVQAEVFTAFYGYNYMPATQMFYLQNENQTSTYPYVSLYFNARIRPVTIFVKVENVLQNYVGLNYSLAPGYFQPDRCFRLGIKWLFFD